MHDFARHEVALVRKSGLVHTQVRSALGGCRDV